MLPSSRQRPHSAPTIGPVSRERYSPGPNARTAGTDTPVKAAARKEMGWTGGADSPLPRRPVPRGGEPARLPQAPGEGVGRRAARGRALTRPAPPRVRQASRALIGWALSSRATIGSAPATLPLHLGLGRVPLAEAPTPAPADTSVLERSGAVCLRREACPRRGGLQATPVLAERMKGWWR